MVTNFEKLKVKANFRRHLPFSCDGEHVDCVAAGKPVSLISKSWKEMPSKKVKNNISLFHLLPI